MRERRSPWALAYGAAVLALFAGVAVWRRDLLGEAWRLTWENARAGGPRFWLALAQSALFGGILLGTWLSVPLEPRPRRDALLLAAAGLTGYLAEAWGTRLGVWTYYTGERPPLWIVPAWPLGALVIERAAARLRALAPAPPPGAYWALAAGCLAVVASFCAPFAGRPLAWAGPAAVALALGLGARPREDFWALAAGAACVAFADYWGTFNGCWEYYARARPLGLWRGIAFGMCFDAALALGALKLSAWRAAASPAWRAGPSPAASGPAAASS